MKCIATLLLCLSAASTFADDPAPPEYESRDPRALSLDELRALRDTLLRVAVPRTDGVSRPEDQMVNLGDSVASIGSSGCSVCSSCA